MTYRFAVSIHSLARPALTKAETTMTDDRNITTTKSLYRLEFLKYDTHTLNGSFGVSVHAPEPWHFRVAFEKQFTNVRINTRGSR